MIYLPFSFLIRPLNAVISVFLNSQLTDERNRNVNTPPWEAPKRHVEVLKLPTDIAGSLAAM